MNALLLKAVDPRLQKAKAQPFEHQVVCPKCHYPFPGGKDLGSAAVHHAAEKTMGWKGRLLVGRWRTYCNVLYRLKIDSVLLNCIGGVFVLLSLNNGDKRSRVIGSTPKSELKTAHILWVSSEAQLPGSSA
jgi:hypothetical protein